MKYTRAHVERALSAVETTQRAVVALATLWGQELPRCATDLDVARRLLRERLEAVCDVPDTMDPGGRG